MSAGCTFPQRKEITARLQIREVHIAETEIEICERRLHFSARKEIFGKTADTSTHCREIEIALFRKKEITARYVKYTLQRPR